MQQELGNIFYRLGNKIYINITNACPCNCIFCIRNSTDGVGDAPSLWLAHEPSLTEIYKAFDNRQDINQCDEIVFCGYGEPMCRPDDVVEIAKYIKNICQLPIRINTNGLVKLMTPEFEISKLAAVDAVSISLNADEDHEYLRISKPSFGIGSYGSLLEFVQQASKYTAVTLTVLEDLLPERIDNCRKLAEDLGVEFRVREYW